MGDCTAIPDTILATVTDLVRDFLYYGRKEDEELPRGKIEEALANGDITIEQIVTKFEEGLRERVPQ